MKIYTKTGDQGKTRLVGGASVSKSDLRVECYGTVDELNSFLGQSLVELETLGSHSELMLELRKIQNRLFNAGSCLACEDSETRKFLPKIEENHITELELAMDRMTEKLPPLKQFILPGGTRSAATLHICRTVCRRAERLTNSLIESQKQAAPKAAAPAATEDSIILIYLNRLSDYFFVAARWVNFIEKRPDLTWQKDL